MEPPRANIVHHYQKLDINKMEGFIFLSYLTDSLQNREVELVVRMPHTESIGNAHSNWSGYSKFRGKKEAIICPMFLQKPHHCVSPMAEIPKHKTIFLISGEIEAHC